jgi:hypothetical protein
MATIASSEVKGTKVSMVRSSKNRFRRGMNFDKE